MKYLSLVLFAFFFTVVVVDGLDGLTRPDRGKIKANVWNPKDEPPSASGRKVFGRKGGGGLNDRSTEGTGGANGSPAGTENSQMGDFSPTNEMINEWASNFSPTNEYSLTKEYTPTEEFVKESTEEFAPTFEFVKEPTKEFAPTLEFVKEPTKEFAPTLEFVKEPTKEFAPTLEFVKEPTEEFAPTLEFVEETTEEFAPTLEFVEEFAPTLEFVNEYVQQYSPTFSQDSTQGGDEKGGEKQSGGGSGSGSGGDEDSKKKKDATNVNENNNHNSFNVDLSILGGGSGSSLPDQESGKDDDDDDDEAPYCPLLPSTNKRKPTAVVTINEDEPNTTHSGAHEVRVQSLKDNEHRISTLLRFEGCRSKSCKVGFEKPKSGSGKVEVFVLSCGEIERATWKRRPERVKKVGTYDSKKGIWVKGDGKVRCGVGLELAYAGDDGGVLWGRDGVTLEDAE